INCSKAVKCTITTTQLKFKTITTTPNLAFSTVDFKTPLYAGRTFGASVEVENNGEEYLGIIQGVIMKNSSVIKLYNLGRYDIPEGHSIQIDFDGDIAESVTPGAYQFAFALEDGTIVSGMQDIEIMESPGPTEAVIENARIPINDGGTGTLEDPIRAFSKNFLVQAELHCTSGYFTDKVMAMIFKPSGGYNIATLDAPYCKVTEGESVTLDIPYDISPVCAVGETYALLFTKSDGQDITFFEPVAPLYFTIVGAVSGIDEIDADEAPAKVDYFDLMGRKIDNPEKGQLLIKVTTSKSGEKVTSKIVF
ncbi:MAG: hypothetical protein ACI4UL_03535, partial [Muribaculaceae bacterium]